MKRDAFGFVPLCYGREHHARSARDLFALEPRLPRDLDRVTFAAHLEGRYLTDRSFFSAVRVVPPSHELIREGRALVTKPYAPRVERGELGALLRRSLRKVFDKAKRPIAVALSGGLDSAIVLALAKEIDPDVVGIVLAPKLDGYDERDAARETARVLGARTHVVEVSAADFRAALPDAIAAMEVPFYNLHPVGKWLLAKAAREGGFTTVISGDAADHVFTRDVSANYLPLVHAAFAAHHVALVTPFLDDDVVAHVLSIPVDANKQELRDVGATLRIPQPLVTERKVSRLTPPIDLDGLVLPLRIASLAATLDLPTPAFDDDRSRVRWTTLALLADAASRWP